MTLEIQETVPVEVGNLIGKVEEFRDGGYRLVQINCSKVGDVYEINYSFDKDYVFKNLRITVIADTEIPSISGMYWGAFIYENEMHDLFGIRVKGMNIDFKGHLFTTAVKFPFSIAPPSTPVKGEKP
jgi:ech hydrogenase subunit D